MLTDHSALLTGMGASIVPAVLLSVLALFRRVYRNVFTDIVILFVVAAVALNAGMASVFLVGEQDWSRLSGAFGFSVGCVVLAFLRALVTPHQEYWSCLALLVPALLAPALIVAIYIFIPLASIPGGTIAGALGVWGARKATKEVESPFLGFLWGSFCGVVIVFVAIIPASLFNWVLFLAPAWIIAACQLRK